MSPASSSITDSPWRIEVSSNPIRRATGACGTSPRAIRSIASRRFDIGFPSGGQFWVCASPNVKGDQLEVIIHGDFLFGSCCETAYAAPSAGLPIISSLFGQNPRGQIDVQVGSQGVDVRLIHAAKFDQLFIHFRTFKKTIA